VAFPTKWLRTAPVVHLQGSDLKPGTDMKPINDEQFRRKKHRLPHELYASTGYEFFFTICARQHGEPFRNSELAKMVVESLLWTSRKYAWQLFCYCLMPDHLHFVCSLTERSPKIVNGGARGLVDEGVLEHVARFKSYTSTKAWDHGIQDALWQKSSFDRILDIQWPFEQVVGYTLQNPQRKGLCERWEDWPYSRIVDAS